LEGPADTPRDPGINIKQLASALLQYKTIDPNAVFGEREAKRFRKKQGIPEAMAKFMPVMTKVKGKTYMG
jgi:hypothetical protein